MRSIQFGTMVPLLVLALAGCGGAAGASDVSATPSAATSTAPSVPLPQQALEVCELAGVYYSDFVTVGDSGHTVTLEGEPDGTHYTLAGVTDKEFGCVFAAVSMPDSVVSQMSGTRALDGTQTASWNKMSATWTYHPNDGLRVILTEAK